MAGIEKACTEAGIEPESISEFSHAMTVSVNALLEEDGAKTALVTTEGFLRRPEIGRQDRPSLYDLNAEKPTPLVPRRRRFEVSERATTDGIEQPVDEDEVRAIVSEIREADVESVAVSFCTPMHILKMKGLPQTYCGRNSMYRSQPRMRSSPSFVNTSGHQRQPSTRTCGRRSIAMSATFRTRTRFRCPAATNHAGQRRDHRC